MSGRNAVVTTHERVIVVQGHETGDALRAARYKAIWAGTVRGWMLDRRHAADVVAVLEGAGYRVRLVEGDA